VTGKRLLPLVGASLALFSTSIFGQCEQGHLEPDVLVADDRFGQSAALQGDLALIGAPAEDTSSAGSVYVFQRSGSDWVQLQVLTPPNPEFDDQFGASVDLHNGVAVVGAPGRNNPDDSGGAFTYRWNGAAFDFEQELVAADPQTGAHFGTDVAVSGNLLVCGTPEHKLLDGGPLAFQQGVAYVFRFNGSSWVPDVGLRALTPENQGVFGSSVDLVSTFALIGASNPSFIGMEQVFLFRRNGGWSFVAELVPDDFAPSMRFGYSLEMGQTHAIVGARDAKNGGGAKVGAAYVFDINGTTIAQAAKLQPAGLDVNAWFGASVAMDGDRALVGAPGQTSGGPDGVVYVFEFDGNDWLAAGELRLPQGSQQTGFGTAVQLEDDRAIASANDGAFPADSGLGAEFLLDAATCQFQTSVDSISLLAGGVQVLSLRPGPAFAGDAYLLLGSASGSVPGIPLPPFTIPLNLDFYFNFTLANANQGPFTNSLGLLDGDGEGQVSIGIPAAFDPIFAGVTLTHAYIVVDAITQTITFVSGATELNLIP